MNLYKITGILFLSIVLLGCQQGISIKKGRFTAINPVSYTDVVYKANRDTVFVSTFDGKIYKLFNGQAKKQQITAIEDEIYDMAYSAKLNRLYVATLNSGIVAINAKNGDIIKKLPLGKTWAKELCYNNQNGILGASDVKGKHYIWDTYNDFKQINTPLALKQTRPKHIADNGDIFFNGKEEILVWNYKTNAIIQKNKIQGQLMDVDKRKIIYYSVGNNLAFTKQGWIVYSIKTNILIGLFMWPIKIQQ